VEPQQEAAVAQATSGRPIHLASLELLPRLSWMESHIQLCQETKAASSTKAGLRLTTRLVLLVVPADLEAEMLLGQG
jgi:hypothetical protein